MALRQVRIGSLPDVFQYDDGDFASAIETDHFIKTTQAPAAAEDVVRLGDLPSGVAELLHSDAVIADNSAVRGDGGSRKVQGSLVTIGDSGDTHFPSYIDISEITTPASPVANNLRLFVEDFKGFSFYSFIDSTGMVRKIVRDSVFVAKNVRGSLIAANRIVYATGNVDDVPTIDLAKADSASTMPAIGVTIESVADGAFGRVIQVGLLENINTAALAVGDILYVSAATAGVPTVVAPTYTNLRQEIGTVLVSDAAVGSIQIVARSVFDDGIIDIEGIISGADIAPGTVIVSSMKSGATQVAAGAAANELWRTSGHASLPDNVVMIGV